MRDSGCVGPIPQTCCSTLAVLFLPSLYFLLSISLFQPLAFGSTENRLVMSENSPPVTCRHADIQQRNIAQYREASIGRPV